jgi:hypothetical protein
MGLASICRNCNRKACSDHRNSNREEIRRGDRARYQTDPEYRQTRQDRAKSYYREHADEVRGRVDDSEPAGR